MFFQACSLRRIPHTLCQIRRYSEPATSAAKKPAPSAAPKSSCPADTVLTGLNYLKGQEPVLAKPDEEYPDWLWTLLEPRVIPDDGPGGRAERYKRRLENKQKIRERNFMLTQ
ncbi:mitochondrial ribosomal protein L37-domain-containing protein [Desarmillaria tabescens]|uniref:Large ribosomal subunit protein mL54 n=1 Tax=Armillaria tabescens TaxID=1929756 RepID=A0AA39T4B9_ARMTA|nr:mitochondrial ribosomal protein L37-domain-containing protein [Desarmillaria tabescens]KAK0463556.1 mitochondrial ribosomal protein L37-domain-containing protein [Desarmillaria tabescens]